ncbi:MAG TPA: N-acetylneuraminate synthase [Brevundimonas sp.]|nr:N-acetylneuraminate synthase [Brevundimonas sp.]
MSGRVFVIAEAGVNHDGSLDDARRMIDVAAAGGADAVKFQTFRAEELVTRRAGKAAYQTRNTGEDGGQMAMLKALELDRDAHRALAAHSAASGVRFMSTAFDLDSLAFLNTLDMPAVKIPSGDLTWGYMLLEAARLDRPLIVSTGMASMDEIRDALSVIAFGLTRPGVPRDLEELKTALASGEGQARLRERVTLLHCTTEYPAPLADVNLRAMDVMAETFGLKVGYSDHTLGTSVAIAAVARGATVIEKHFTLDRTRPGPDHAASLEPDELTAMIAAIREVETALGQAVKAPSAVELPNRAIARRSLVAARPIAAGEALSLDNLTAKRPADGLSPMAVWPLLGQPANRAYDADEAIEA